MSSNRNGSNSNDRPTRPILVSSRSSRTPTTPKIASVATPPSKTATARKDTSVKSEPLSTTPRLRALETGSNSKTGLASGNVTPRSPARMLRTDSRDGTPQAERASNVRPRSTIAAAGNIGTGQPGIIASPALPGRPKSTANISSLKIGLSPSVRSPWLASSPLNAQHDVLDGQFFHASDVSKQESTPKVIEGKKSPAFFYADGQQENERQSLPPKSSSPQLPASTNSPITGQKGPPAQNPTSRRSPPRLSPALSALSGTSPFFAIDPYDQARNRSPSPGRENVHLSYRKGASQIFGARPPAMPRADTSPLTEVRRPSLTSSSIHMSHRKSPSMSSIDSGGSSGSRRRSATIAENMQASSPLAQETVSPSQSISSASAKPPLHFPTIYTSLDILPVVGTPSDICLSPTKQAADLAIEARRERKVLDLEISNSSLLAINASLERELRKQKTELKRYRRLTRAGRFSAAPNDRLTRLSDGLGTLGEEVEEDGADDSYFGRHSFSTQDDDFSDDDESITSGGEPLSPSTRHRDRLARDETKLQLDLAKHKELLVQSQMMNQSLKRCMYATEDMIKEGKKALQYHVRVSDVKLGGRILTGHEDSDEDREEIEVEDDFPVGEGVAIAKGFVESWTGVAGSFDGSEGGDRDSGIEVDNPARRHVNGTSLGMSLGKQDIH